ncbi:MAG: pyruvate dehydrogenase complex dihydrolipoamide acetyltransferase [Saprospirales bacterium]|nr:MAG: pyruvate dehydrogenase complex dihydrolipoamide acetyltransferase [Saprospirales bacterium]
MAEVIKMPRMSDTMEEGVIVAWHKEVGDTIEPGDILAEVETDKATMDLESYQEGTLLYIGVKEGAVPVDSVIAVIGEEGEDYQAALDAEGGSTDNDSGEKEGEEKEIEPAKSKKEEAKKAEVKEEQAVAEDSSGDERIKISPLARKMAEEANIDPANIEGTGENGRIVKRDVEKAIETGVSSPSAPAVSAGPEFEKIPVSQMRKTIAKRLGESKFSAPHFYLTIDIDMSNAMATRKRINDLIAPDKISFNDLVVKASAAALKLHPAINSSWMGDHIRRNNHINIGVAVAVDEGLLVPVVKNADVKTMTTINKEVAAFAEKARSKKLQPEEMQGNTFTISNLGMFGIEEFTAIINPPDACIMAVGGIRSVPVVENGEVKPGHRMKVTLSCDHRVVDGATGAKFLADFKAMLEEPVRMIV